MMYVSISGLLYPKLLGAVTAFISQQFTNENQILLISCLSSPVFIPWVACIIVMRQSLETSDSQGKSQNPEIMISYPANQNVLT